jgi:eukaryotic-like serine/threonine-protein kinase
LTDTSFTHPNYEVIEKLGAGGMATVYRCRDLRSGALRAVKVLDSNLAHKTEVLIRFEKEAAAMDKVSHPNIVPIHDLCLDGDYRFIVMDLIDGESLVDRMERGKLSGQEAVRIMISVLKALEAAHETGIVHRDIKPHNILISRAEHVFVTDFGIARCSDDTDMSITRTGVVMGTWAYMAPEQRADAKGVDHLADIYSAGATLFAAVTGQTPKDLFAAELDPTIYKGVPPAIEAVIRRACAYWTSDRYPTAAAMGADLELTLGMLKADDGREKTYGAVGFRTDPGSLSPGVPPPPLGVAKPKPVVRRPGPAPRAHSSRGVLWMAAAAGLVLMGILGWMYTKTLAPVEEVQVEVVIPETQRRGRIGTDEMGAVKPISSAIVHEPPTQAEVGEGLHLTVGIPGSTVYDQVLAWYRPIGTVDWSKAKLRKVGDGYEGNVDVTRVFASGLEYWIEAKPYTSGLPVLSSASPRRPHQVKVSTN